jgi:hypothetical protein
MFEHLGTWTFAPTETFSARLDLWDTGRTRDGKSELRYALWLCDGDLTLLGQSAIFEGEDFYPSPLHAIDSDVTAAALVSFLAADGEAIRFAPDDDYADARAHGYTEKQRELLASNYELLSLWEMELTETEE